MDANVKCVFCGTRKADMLSADSARVPCYVREFAGEVFTVWRCGRCHSLHVLESIDYDRYYRNYPIKRQQYDGFTRLTCSKRIKLLSGVGLTKGATLLDHGCGSGHFVRYARAQGILAEGYDPYSSEFGDASVLARQYQFVTSQDVIEHVDNPSAVIDELKRYVAPGGYLVIGTPNADGLDLHDELDQNAIHAPYHRHIYAAAELQRDVARNDWEVVDFRKEWYVDTWVPFVNSAFLFRYFQSGGGFMDIGFDPVSPMHFIKHPSLLFWGFFGRLFPSQCDMLVVARKRVR